MKTLTLFFLLVAATPSLFAQKAGRQDTDPLPEDFVMMDKGAELIKQSLIKNFVYPDSARKQGIQGTVNVQVLIGKKGNAEKYLIEAPIHPLLDSAAARAVMAASYKSAVYDGKPIKTWMIVPIIFTLGKTKAVPAESTEPEEGDGYTKVKYDSAAFFSALNFSWKDVSSGLVLKIAAHVDSVGNVLEVRNSSQCSDEVFNEVKRVVMQTKFTPSVKSGKNADDWLTIVVPLK